MVSQLNRNARVTRGPSWICYSSVDVTVRWYACASSEEPVNDGPCQVSRGASLSITWCVVELIFCTLHNTNQIHGQLRIEICICFDFIFTTLSDWPIKDVRADCFCPSLLPTLIHEPHRASIFLRSSNMWSFIYSFASFTFYGYITNSQSGSLIFDFLCPLWLVRVITLALVVPHSVESSSISG